MRYFGERSLSSFLKVVLQVAWFVVLIGAVAAAAWGALVLFATPVTDASASGLAHLNYLAFDSLKGDASLHAMRALPVAVKMLFLPYLVVIVVLMLRVIRRSQFLFDNFRKEAVFRQENVESLKTVSRLLIVLSIITFNLTSLLVAIILIIVTEILKNGTSLQEEHDLTV